MGGKIQFVSPKYGVDPNLRGIILRLKSNHVCKSCKNIIEGYAIRYKSKYYCTDCAEIVDEVLPEVPKTEIEIIVEEFNENKKFCRITINKTIMTQGRECSIGEIELYIIEMKQCLDKIKLL